MNTYEIIETTDGKFVGQTVTTDLHTIEVNGQSFDIAGTLPIGSGNVRAFNSNYVFDLKPV